MTNQNELQKTLIEELGLNDLPEDKKEQMLIKMTEVILKRVFLETMTRLSEEDREKYEKMIDEGASLDRLEVFLRGKIQGYDDLTKEIIEKFEEEMKGVTGVNNSNSQKDAEV
jgi:hypothetical protein